MRPERCAMPLAAMVAVLTGCSTARDALTFAPIAACFRMEQPAERAFRTAGEWEDFYRATALRPATAPPPVDFAQRMVAARFDGGGSACVGFTVEGVEADEEAVTVRAVRHTSPGPCIAILAYPQVVLEVERRDLPVRFSVRDVRGDPPPQTATCF